jgi:dimethylargininase
MPFTRAVVRTPAGSFAAGLSSAGSGHPDLDKAMTQHSLYVSALRNCGLQVTTLSADDDFPDGTFVEDTAIVTARGAVITLPGAPSRAGEIVGITDCLRHFYSGLERIAAPGTVDGGDICEADGHFLIGISARTNPDGAAQLAAHLQRMGYTSSTLDIRSNSALLHLKSGIAYLDHGLWVVDAAIRADLSGHPGIELRDTICVTAAESYAANCIRVNDSVFMASGFPVLRAALRDRGCQVVELDMSEFRKMDGGLSCLSLRF